MFHSLHSVIADIYIAPLQVGLLRSAPSPKRGQIALMLFYVTEGISGRILVTEEPMGDHSIPVSVITSTATATASSRSLNFLKEQG